MSNDNETTKPAPKRSGGHPTKYQPEYCETLIEHLGAGYSFESFAGLLRVNKSTIYNWLVLYPEFKEAKEVADGLSRLWAETQLKLQVQGDAKANPIPLIFFLKNRFPNEWRDRKEIDLKKDDENKSNNLTLDEQLAQIEAMRAHLLELKSREQGTETLTICTSSTVDNE